MFLSSFFHPSFRWIRAEHIAALGMTDPRGRYEVEPVELTEEENEELERFRRRRERRMGLDSGKENF